MVKIRTTLRRMAPALATAALLVILPAQAFAAKTFDVSGTIASANDEKRTIVLVTTDVIGSAQPITIDMSNLDRLFRSTDVGSPLTIRIIERESDTFLALGEIHGGSLINNENFGVNENFTVREDAITSCSKNGPADDDAIAKQHRNSNLEKKKKDNARTQSYETSDTAP